jgi:hypothetical protein
MQVSMQVVMGQSPAGCLLFPSGALLPHPAARKREPRLMRVRVDTVMGSLQF